MRDHSRHCSLGLLLALLLLACSSAGASSAAAQSRSSRGGEHADTRSAADLQDLDEDPKTLSPGYSGTEKLPVSASFYAKSQLS